jgi:hypothetical protein
LPSRSCSKTTTVQVRRHKYNRRTRGPKRQRRRDAPPDPWGVESVWTGRSALVGSWTVEGISGICYPIWCCLLSNVSNCIQLYSAVFSMYSRGEVDVYPVVYSRVSGMYSDHRADTLYPACIQMYSVLCKLKRRAGRAAELTPVGYPTNPQERCERGSTCGHVWPLARVMTIILWGRALWGPKHHSPIL